jgi:hypothetical protein
MPIVVLMVPGCSCVCTVKKRLTNLDVDSGGAEPNGMGVEKVLNAAMFSAGCTD